MRAAGFDLRHPYLKKHLIAYIGNKRALQGFLYEVFRSFSPQRGAVFLDPFAGSGAVSRLARAMGFRVLAGDREFYAYVLNYAHLCIEGREVPELFRPWGGAEALFRRLNRLPPPQPENRYVSRYYAPADTATADYRRERLFYTRENALRIDALRNAIEELYPGFDLEARAYREKMLLLASLIYRSATHTNTSGVFKACHKGFGGHGRDALGRITAPIQLELPVLFDSEYPSEAFCLEAADFVRHRPARICYLDPPYNQHQYGSNYHLLNTIALWDKPPVSNERGPDGRLKHKAAIRQDWVKTRSAYCYRDSAPAAFAGLLDAIDARFVLLSYNTEGIIPFEELVEIMAGQGCLSLFTSDYIKYRGGKQSIDRQVYNLEFVLVLDRNGRTGPRDYERLEEVLLRKRLRLLLKKSFDPKKISAGFRTERDAILLEVGRGRALRLPMPHLYRFGPFLSRVLETVERLSPGEMKRFREKLSSCECKNKEEEIAVLVDLLRNGADERSRGLYQQRILWLFKKFAHRKYRHLFSRTLEELKCLCRLDPEVFGPLAEGLARIERLAEARFNG